MSDLIKIVSFLVASVVLVAFLFSVAFPAADEHIAQRVAEEAPRPLVPLVPLPPAKPAALPAQGVRR